MPPVSPKRDFEKVCVFTKSPLEDLGTVNRSAASFKKCHRLQK